MYRVRSFVLAGLLSVASSVWAGATVDLYNNGQPNGVTGFAISTNPVGDFTSADDFTASGNWTVTQLVFWTLGVDYQPGDLPIAFNYLFFLFGSSTPFAVGQIPVTSADLVRSTEASCCGLKGYYWDPILSSPVQLQTGKHYMLGIQAVLGKDVGEPYSSGSHYWASTSPSYTDPSNYGYVARTHDGPYSFSSNGTTALAFILRGPSSDMPEPGTLVLLASGLGFLGWLGRKKRNVT